MEVMEAVKGRRTIRRYKTQPVSNEALQTVLEAARWAPSWANTQCWSFVVVRDAQKKAQIAGYLQSSTPGRENRAVQALKDAPVLIVACAERFLSGFQRAGEHKGFPATDKGDWFMFDLALAMENLVLAAYSLGLGTAHVGNFDAVAVAKLLKLPQNTAVVELMPLGYPDESPEPRPRKELKEMVFYEEYGKTKP
ncbi:MAG: nitroreductase family protein [Chloroflexota bacterium]|nr:nitroreductase family protein [Chloroflexota bacterium]